MKYDAAKPGRIAGEKGGIAQNPSRQEESLGSFLTGPAKRHEGIGGPMKKLIQGYQGGN